MRRCRIAFDPQSFYPLLIKAEDKVKREAFMRYGISLKLTGFRGVGFKSLFENP